MNIKISKQEYKKHHFPIYLLLYYIILSLVSVVLLESLAILMLSWGISGFLDQLLGIALIVFVGGLLWFFECLIFRPKLNKGKIYRGIGIKRFLTICSCLCPIIFVAVIVFLNLADINYIFFNIVTLFTECAIPFLLSLEIQRIIRYDEIYICPDCGLINSYIVTKTSMADLGTKHKFHNEGGYRHTWKTPVGVMVEDVPTTVVYDGEFRKWETTTYSKCSVCGRQKTGHKSIETRID